MSRGSGRRRGSGGHPARAAARRQRDQPARARVPEEVAMARSMANSAATIESALEAEEWASTLLGTFEEARHRLPPSEGLTLNAAMTYGELPVRELARLTSPGAAVALAAIADLDPGDLGTLAKELMDAENVWSRLPSWAGEIGESEIVGAAIMHEAVFGDAQTVFLESCGLGGETLAVGVVVAVTLGGLATDVLLADSIDDVEHRIEQAGEAGELRIERIEPGIAAGLISDALSLTDATWDPPVTEEYWAGQGLARLRADQTPDAVVPEHPVDYPQADRDALCDEFLASPEGAGFAPGSDGARTAALAIEFCADYLEGDPTRWSPGVVELFMVDWIPDLAMATVVPIDVLPAALDAWVRFAARRRGTPDAALAQTREAIAECTPEMLEAIAEDQLAENEPAENEPANGHEH